MTKPTSTLAWLAPALLAAAGASWLALTPARWARASGAGGFQLVVGILLFAASVRLHRRRSVRAGLSGAAVGLTYWLVTHVLRSPFEEAPRALGTAELVPLALSAAAFVLLLWEARRAPEHASGPPRDIALVFAIGIGVFLIIAGCALSIAAEPIVPNMSVGYHAVDIEKPPGTPAETRSPMLNHTNSWSFTFPDAIGRYYYHCMPHDDVMNGFVTVTDEANAPMSLNLTIRDFAFVTPEPVIHTGGTIVWTNTGNAQHDVMILSYDVPEKRGVSALDVAAVLSAMTFAVLLRRDWT